MQLNWFDRLGDWNPQMLRELKGRLISRNVAIALISSLTGQFLIFLFFFSKLPDNQNSKSGIYSLYCTGRNTNCLRDAGDPIINWSLWWLHIFMVFSWILPLILLVGGVYMLLADLAKEQQRGTLNFIRLSPQSSQNILLGKILGVPVLLYLAIALAVPVHLAAAIAASVPFSVVLGLYILLGTVCYLFYSAALLYAFLAGVQAGLGNILSLAFGIPCLQAINFYLSTVIDKTVNYSWIFENKLQWFYLPIASNLELTYSFALLNCGLGIYWIWQVLNRRFCNPSATSLSKKQSYWLVACVQGWILGFLLPDPQFILSKDDLFVTVGLLSSFNLITFLVLIAALSPQRQALQDWARYRRDRVSASQKLWNRSLVQDLIWGEKSPPLLAIALNLAMTGCIWVPWILLWPAGTPKAQAIWGLLLSLNLILIYAAIAELLLFMKTPNRNLWAASTVGASILLPPILLAMSSGGEPHGTAANLLLFSPFLWITLDHVSTTTMFLTFLGQWSILGFLSLQLTRQLRRVGTSASVTLLAEHSS